MHSVITEKIENKDTDNGDQEMDQENSRHGRKKRKM